MFISVFMHVVPLVVHVLELIIRPSELAIDINIDRLVYLCQIKQLSNSFIVFTCVFKL